MSADAVHVRSSDSRIEARDTSRVREAFFILLMALLAMSLGSEYVSMEAMRYYNYLCWVVFGASILIAGFVCCVREPPTIGVSVAIFFSFLSLFVAGYAKLTSGGSFGSGLFSFIVTTLGYLTIGQGRREVQRYVLLLYASCGAILIAAFIAPRDTFAQINMFSLVLIYGLVFALVLGHRYAAVAILLVIAVCLARRPSSNLFVGTFLGIAMVYCFGSRPKLASIASCVAVTALAMMALAAMSDPEWANVVGDLEAFVKETILGGESTSDTRAALIVATQRRFVQGSFLFGSYFAPDTPLDLSDIFTQPDVIAPVHSDFVQMLYRGGFVSLVAMTYFFCELSFLHRRGDSSPESEVLRRTVPICTAVYAFYISFNPLLTHLEYSLWFFALSFLCLGLRPGNKSAPVNLSR